MTPKKYKINTIQDIIESTNQDNIKNFLIDLELFIKIVHTANTIDQLRLKPNGFVWCDDGEHNINIEFKK